MGIKSLYKKLAYGKLSPLFSLASKALTACEYAVLSVKWRLQGGKLPNADDISLLRENATFIFKSFERQKLAKGLCRNIKKYYPGVKVIIADDSSRPLELRDDDIQVVQLPFNSGLGFGLNRALERVETPFVIRMDDDELLTPFSDFHKHLRFLMEHTDVDLIGVSHISAPRCISLEKTAQSYYVNSVANAPKPLKIAHLTKLNDDYTVLGKVPNIFIARTSSLRSVGYDDNIRIIDHHDFFYRAAGNIVSAFAPRSFVFHRHNSYDMSYQRYRSDYQSDLIYIRQRNMTKK